MPRFRLTQQVTTGDLVMHRCTCDGCDAARPPEERCREAQLWLVTAGAFELRDCAGRHVVDPSHAVVIPPDHGYTIRHPAGPDVCLSFRGPLVDRLAEAGPRCIELPATLQIRIAHALAAFRRGHGDALAIAEPIAELAALPTSFPSPDLAYAIAHELRLRFAEATTLGDLATATGYSPFHACHVFRAATGTTIHAYRRELQLRHALAMLLDTDEPIAQVAARAGFASQSHLTNRFRARFGVTPGRARRDYFVAPSLSTAMPITE
jgi:AraC-like DNA-binding protein